MSLFANMKRTDDVEAPKDTLGGGGYIKETGVYTAVIKVVYAFKSKNGAQGIQTEFLLEDGSTYKETLYITKRTGEHTYERNGKKFYMPGYITVDELCAVATGHLLSDQPTDDKIVKVYEHPHGEVDKEVPVLTDLTNKKVKLAIQKIVEYKQADDGTGKWVDTAETREKNEIIKCFDADGFTVIELMDKAEDNEYLEAWEEKNNGKTYDKTAGKKPKGTGLGSPKASSAPKKSLFGSK